MTDRELTKNITYNILRILASILFPLMTYKYITVTIGVDGVGKIEFARSFVNYFCMLSGLGISLYAVRTGAEIRDNRQKLNRFANHMLGINYVSALVAMAVFVALTVLVSDIRVDISLGYIYLLQIPITVFSVEWLFSIFEDFKYITIRSVFCQVVSLAAILLFVKQPGDEKLYALIMVGAMLCAGVFNRMRAWKYLKLRPMLSGESLTVIAPVILLFMNSVASFIYLELDVTMIGFMRGAADVGSYSAAVKIYSSIQQLVGAIMTVVLPRMSYYAGTSSYRNFADTESWIISLLFVLIPPCTAGIFMQAENLILAVSAPEYLGGAYALRILAVALIPSTIAYLCCNTVLFPYHKERYVLLTSSLAAGANFILNIVFIRRMGISGAALTTLLSEIIVAALSLVCSLQLFKGARISFRRTILPCTSGILITIAINRLICSTDIPYMIQLLAGVTASVLCYITLLLVAGNKNAQDVAAFFTGKDGFRK